MEDASSELLHVKKTEPLTILLLFVIAVIVGLGFILDQQIDGIKQHLDTLHTTVQHADSPHFPEHSVAKKHEELNNLIYLQRLYGTIGMTGIIILLLYAIFIDDRRYRQNNQLRNDLIKLNKHLEHRVDQTLIQHQRQEEMLQQRAKMVQMGEIISIIAHQWRQPLTSITTTADLLNLRIQKDQYQAELFAQKLENISQYAHCLSGTIDDFRDFFRSDEAAVITTFPHIVEKSLSIFGETLKTQNITVKTFFHCHNSSCKGQLFTFPNELRQAVISLLKNAEEALTEANVDVPYIILETEAADKTVSLSVEDNAGGIHGIDLDQIFDSFYTTKEAKGGTGLGLYVSKIIIEERCGGTLHVSNGEQGARFTITLNADMPAASSDFQSSSYVRNLSGKN